MTAFLPSDYVQFDTSEDEGGIISEVRFKEQIKNRKAEKGIFMSQLLRVKCPSCGQVVDFQGNGPCRKCGNAIALPEDGVIQIYRMGNPMGMGVGMGIYLNGIPLGHLANTDSVRIPVSYGHYKLHMTLGLNRKCKEQEFDVTPDNRFAYFKAHVMVGFWSNTVVIEQATPEEMPSL